MASGSSNGKVVISKLATIMKSFGQHYKKTLFDTLELKVHQTGVNALRVIDSGEQVCILVSVGEDQLLSISKLSNSSGNLSSLEIYKVSCAHNGAVTGCLSQKILFVSIGSLWLFSFFLWIRSKVNRLATD